MSAAPRARRTPLAVLALLAVGACMGPTGSPAQPAAQAPPAAPQAGARAPVVAGHRSDPQQAPKVVPYRSRWERLAAAPGMVLYAPLRIPIDAAQLAAAGVWEYRLLDRLAGWLTTADGRTGVRPLSNTIQGTGLRLFHRAPGGDVGLTSSWGRDPGNRQHHVLTVEPAAVEGATVTASLQREPGERFYGIGMQARQADRTRYRQALHTVRFRLQRHPRSPLSWTLGLGWRAIDVGPARDGTDPSTTRVYGGRLPGLGEAAHYLEAEAAVRSRRVDVPGSPRNGNITRLRGGLHAAVDGGDLRWVSLEAVSEQFLELFYGRTLSLRVGADWRVPVAGGQVPFYDLASVGGDVFVRGFQAGRFRDRGALFGGLRYKVPLWKMLDGALFYEAGRTFGGLDELSARDWRGAWGGGLRLWVRSRVILQQWVALSDEDWRLLFNFETDF